MGKERNWVVIHMVMFKRGKGIKEDDLGKENKNKFFGSDHVIGPTPVAHCEQLETSQFADSGQSDSGG